MDTLDAGGQLTVKAPLKVVKDGRATQATLEAVVTDVNRQTVYASASAMVHPAEFYLGAKPEGAQYFWKAGTAENDPGHRGPPRRPAGGRRRGSAACSIRREWHQVRREQRRLVRAGRRVGERHGRPLQRDHRGETVRSAG